MDAFRACAADLDPKVRRVLARTVGNARIGLSQVWGIKLIDLMIALSGNEDPRVRYDAVYFGLTPLPAIEGDGSRIGRSALDDQFRSSQARAIGRSCSAAQSNTVAMIAGW